MNKRNLQLKRTLCSVLLVLLLFAAGMTKMYASFDFSAVCSTGQTLYYRITDATNYSVALTYPGTVSYNGWYGYTKPIGVIILPESVQHGGITYSVTSISNYAFYECSELTGSLTIPNFVTSIGNYAFSGCSGFTSISIPNSVTSIGVSAFSETAWYNNQPDGILYVSDCCLGYKGPKPTGELCLQEGTRLICNSAFEGCSDLTGSLTIPNSVTTIEFYAFKECTGFTGSLTIGNSVTLIGDCAFGWCSGFTGLLSIPNSVTTIEGQAFYDCSGFTSLTLGNAVTTIGGMAFHGCTGFSGTLTLPSTLTTVGQGAFGEFEPCNFTDINYMGDIAQWCNISFDGFEANPLRNAHNLYINGSLVTNLVIPETVTVIKDFVFHGASCFTGNLIIPNSVTTIGIGAFAGCSGFTGELVIPNSVTAISVCTNEGGWGSESLDQMGAFQGCEGIVAISIPNTVTSIGSHAFSGTGWYNNQPDGILYLDGCCLGFKGSWTQFTQYIIHAGCIQIAEGTRLIANLAIPGYLIDSSYGGYYSYGDLTLPESLIIIGDGAFEGCRFTGSLIIPNSVTEIGDYAFHDCSNFTGDLTIPNSVITIGKGAFAGCSGFTGSLNLPNSVYQIGEEAFSNCSGFDSTLIIGKSVSSIGYYAFVDCRNFNSVYCLANTPPTIGWTAFYRFPTNVPVYVPYGNIDSYRTAMGWDVFSNYNELAYTNVSGYGESNGWNFIASPLTANTAPTEINDMLPTTGTYDLYLFDQTENAEWRNYKANNFNLVNGQGYLYANAEDVNLIFKGTFNEDETKNVELVYDANASFAGWNLVGNPFPVNAYANKSYYTMNEDGSAIEPVAVSMETAIPACTGVMVKAENTGESVTFSKTAPETQGQNNGSLQIAVAQANTRGASTSSATILDKAVVSFNEGDELGKFVFNKDNAKLYIPQGNEEYAIACAEKLGEMSLNFEATENGEYTISIKAENTEFGYLHLIDNLTGADIDLLPLGKGGKEDFQPATYTFTAKTTDYASRFRLVFSVSGDAASDNGAPFAFISNGSIIVSDANADATLQIVDMTGHIIVSADVARNISTNGMAQGVYVLRLIKGDEVKTQRIVVE